MKHGQVQIGEKWVRKDTIEYFTRIEDAIPIDENSEAKKTIYGVWLQFGKFGSYNKPHFIRYFLTSEKEREEFYKDLES